MNGQMTTSSIREISETRGIKMMTRSEVVKLRTECKELMWGYYSDNKSIFFDYIGDFREDIIIELMKGGDVVEVFEMYGGKGMLRAS